MRHEEHSSVTEYPEVRLGHKVLIFVTDRLSKPFEALF
jgi:hypothetical protein